MITHELRWFVPSTITDEALAAFADGRALERRSDAYLFGTGDTRGIKRRGEILLEDKRREATLELRVELDGVVLVGTIERWHKQRPARVELGGEWIVVHKRRAHSLVHGCRAELTGLALEHPRLDRAEFQTFALELGPDDSPARTLAAGVRSLLRTHPDVLARYAGAPSLGYPAWLARLQ